MIYPVLIDVTDKISVDAPLSLYLSLRDRRYPYLLESVEKSGQRARFSFVGADPSAVVRLKNREIEVEVFNGGEKFLSQRLSGCAEIEESNYGIKGRLLPEFDMFDALRAAIPCPRSDERNFFGRQVFLGGGIGYIAYDMVKERLGRVSTSSTPDAQFAIVESTFIFDHLMRRVYFAVVPMLPGAKTDLIGRVEGVDEYPENSELRGRIVRSGDPEEYMEAVVAAKKHIIDGDIFQVVLARFTDIECSDTIALYRNLRRINPSPYTYLFEFGDIAIVGASPETLFNTYAGTLRVNPIAGTCPRGRTPEEDEALARAMLNDEKERAEHVMLVDLGRNDVRSVCRAGSVRVEDFMSVLRYSHVQHIETTVSGVLREECDQFDAARAVFPAGTLSGAPKMRAMEIIDDLEREPRGIYGGGIGYFSADGSADFAIAIRSVILKDNIARVQAGAGIVADSEPERELAETERKMGAMKRALGVID
ncbi:MAG: anthranilate synthase component I [Methanothrix sp.]|nr:anthranilate synthase component I [Methanothrix sp.]MCX8206866.1 anthranilate synthase component I [Methanothrix sp.]